MKVKVVENYKKFYGILKTISSVNVESIITFSSSGVHIRIVDLSSVMLLNIHINKDFFDEYEVSKNESFNINFELMSKIVGSLKNGFVVENTQTELIFKDVRKKVTRSLKIYAGEEDTRPTPQFEYKAEYSLSSEEFKDNIELSSEVGDIVCFVCGNELKLNVNGVLEKIEIELSDKKIEEEQKVYLSLDYLNKFTGLTDVFENVTIKLASNCPFFITAEEDKIKMEGMLAARIAEDTSSD